MEDVRFVMCAGGGEGPVEAFGTASAWPGPAR